MKILDAREPDTCGDMLTRWGFGDLVQSHVPGELRAVPDPARANSPSARLERILTRVLTGGTYLDRHAAQAAGSATGDTPMGKPRDAPRQARRRHKTGAFGKRFLKSSGTRIFMV